MTDDYNAALREIEALRRRLRSIESAAGVLEPPVTYSSRQLEDRDFFKRNESDILAAAREPGTPRILEEEPVERPAPEYPESIIPGWRTVGPDQFEAPMPAPKSKGPR
jgi:hypothetical protein